MKTNFFAALTAALLLAAAPAPASISFDSTTQNGGSPINLPVPDGNTVGIQSTIYVSDLNYLPGSGNNVILTLNISGGNNGDLYAYLSYGGQIVTLLNRPGVTGGNPVGYTDAGFNVTLSDGNSGNINTYGSSSYTTSGGQVTGTYNPSAGSIAFQSYNGMDPNGDWILFVADRSGGDPAQSILNSWSLTFTPVPEPVNAALAALGLLFAGCQLVRWRRGRNRADQV
jgi:subtilisin-like proprotein convertase family protein